MKILKILFLSMFILESSACVAFQQQAATPTIRNEVNIGDGGLLSAEPCGPPCFMGITPGISTEKDAVDSLTKARIFFGCKQEYSILCPHLGLTIRMDNNRQTVRDVIYHPQNVSLGNLIEKHGPPDGWTIECSQDEVANIVCPPVWLDLFYLKLGMRVLLEYQQQNDMLYEASQDSMIDTVHYTSESLENWNFNSPWRGYGEYRRE